jgi:iron complex outermembrane receptor protein
LASPNLKPEKSRSFTGGLIFNPIKNVEFTVDYYNIRKTGAITAPSIAPALAAYYAGTAIPAGYTVIADAPDPNFPTTRPRIAFVASQLINANTIKSEGIDFGAHATFDLGFAKWTTNVDASWIIELSTTFPDGTKETYVDTLGNFNLTAGSGTFRWRGNWQNTLDFGKVAVTLTTSFVGKIKEVSTDQQQAPFTTACTANLYKVPSSAPNYTAFCFVDKFINNDFNVTFKPNEDFNVWFTVKNLFDAKAPVAPAAYASAPNFLTTWHYAGLVGRAFRLGANYNWGTHPRVAPVEPYVAPPPPPPAPATQTCPDGSVIDAAATCPAPPPPPPPAPAPERGF